MRKVSYFIGDKKTEDDICDIQAHNSAIYIWHIIVYTCISQREKIRAPKTIIFP